MTMVTPIGAVPHTLTPGWHLIPWKKATRNVKRLQSRIVKAIQEGRWNKAKALQRLLTHSFSAKAMAVNRVTENRGKKTPGVDGQLWNTPAKKFDAIHSLKKRGYKPLPLKRIYIPKSNNPSKKRPLSIPCMKDRAMQALYLLALDPIAETRIDLNSYGFRVGRSCADAIEQCFFMLAKRAAPQFVLEGDIRSCFDTISHQWLEENIPMDKEVLRKWLKSGYIDRKTFHQTEEGTPQGSIISPTLCNLTLAGLEKELRQSFPKRWSSPDKNPKVNFIAYADDFVITGATPELLESQVKPLVEEFLAKRGLKLSEEKTKITHINEGFDFLGQNLRKYNGKLLIKPSRNSVNKLLRKIRKIVKDYSATTAENLISLLNPVIRGWVYYHRHVVSSKIFNDIDRAIFHALWKWAKRRHPHKTGSWIQDKYFPPHGLQRWRFGVRRIGEAPLQIFKASSLAIKRHTKIRSNANPYDPEQEIYFDQRFGQKLLQGEKGRKRMVGIWKSQKGKCPVCTQTITEDTGWEIHHIQYRVNGGSDKLANLMLLHPNCHRQTHSQKLTVVKPDPRQKGLRRA